MGDLSNNFSREEFACSCGCGFNVVDAELLAVLQTMREELDASIHINSSCRCLNHNKEIGGSPKSQHLLGKAADINVKGCTPLFVQEYLLGKYKGRYGIGSYKSFTHIDVRGVESRWIG